MQIAPSWIDLFMFGAAMINVWLQMNIRLKIAEMKLEMSQTYLTKKDFSDWSKRSPHVPTFKEHP